MVEIYIIGEDNLGYNLIVTVVHYYHVTMYVLGPTEERLGCT